MVDPGLLLQLYGFITNRKLTDTYSSLEYTSKKKVVKVVSMELLGFQSILKYVNNFFSGKLSNIMTLKFLSWSSMHSNTTTVKMNG